MGNCTSGQQKKKKGNAAPTDESNENRPNEDVMYASINHTGLGPRQDKAANKHQPDDDCDYAIVKIQEEVPADSHSESSKDECADDYVLMG